MNRQNASVEQDGQLRKGQFSGRYDLVVVGSGPAGACAVRTAIRLGARVALVARAEKGTRFNLPERPGECFAQIKPGPFFGPGDDWIVAHILRQSAQTAHRLAAFQTSQSHSHGLGSIDFAAVMEQIADALNRNAATALDPDLADAAVDVYVGRAVFTERDTLQVEGRPVQFRRAVIAAGTRPTSPEIEGADRTEPLTSHTLGRLRKLPRRLAVVGRGPVECQLAQSFGRLGSEVHLLGRGNGILPDVDPRAASVVQTQLAREGIRLHLECGHLAIEKTGNLPTVLTEREGRREKLFVDEVFLEQATEPDTAGLQLESAGVACTDRGIVVSDRLQTTNRRVFAAGGVCGRDFSSPLVAHAMGRICAHNALCRGRRKLSRLAVPRCVYTDPQVAIVGITPAEALKQRSKQRSKRQLPIDTCRVELAELDAPVLAGGREGSIAVYLERPSGRIVGACVVAEEACELIGPLAMSITRKWSPAALADVIPCRPSHFELLTQLADRWADSRPSRWAALLERWHGWRSRSSNTTKQAPGG